MPKLTNEEAFAKFDHDGDGRPGGSLPKGARKMAKAKTTTKAAPKKAAPKTQVTKRGDQTPEAKATPKEQSKAAEKLFTDADTAARLGLPESLTVEQRENQVRRSALGY